MNSEERNLYMNSLLYGPRWGIESIHHWPDCFKHAVRECDKKARAWDDLVVWLKREIIWSGDLKGCLAYCLEKAEDLLAEKRTILVKCPFCESSGDTKHCTNCQGTGTYEAEVVEEE